MEDAFLGEGGNISTNHKIKYPKSWNVVNSYELFHFLQLKDPFRNH